MSHWWVILALFASRCIGFYSVPKNTGWRSKIKVQSLIAIAFWRSLLGLGDWVTRWQAAEAEMDIDDVRPRWID